MNESIRVDEAMALTRRENAEPTLIEDEYICDSCGALHAEDDVPCSVCGLVLCEVCSIKWHEGICHNCYLALNKEDSEAFPL